jgi:predicted phosphodiesterase
MKIAVIADIHGNQYALEAVLADIQAESADHVICVGDMIGCHFTGSAAVIERLKQLNVPMVRGNQEDFVIAFHDPQSDPLLRTAVRYQPMQNLAQELPTLLVRKLDMLPMTLRLPGPGGDDVLFCHGIPSDTRRSFAEGLDGPMIADLRAARASTIAAGHWHIQWHRYWEGKLLVLAGSAGLTLRGKPDEADYLLLEHQGEGWQFRHKTITYDHQAALRTLLENDILRQGGPIGWLMLDEVLSQQDRLYPFFTRSGPLPWPDDQPAWEEMVISYLKAKGRWEVVSQYLS